MTLLEEQLIKAGDTLARAIGHRQGCPKIARSIPCNCGAGGEQGHALADWDRLSQQAKAS